MAARTVVDIDKLKAALKDLQNLQLAMGHSDSAQNDMTDLTTTAQDFGPLIGNTGSRIAQYIDARSAAIGQALQKSSMGLQTVVTLLSTTISNYEANEKTHAHAANATGTGGGSGSTGGSGGGSGSGSGSGGAGRGKD
jgi:uncharacterized membrane protein YgcG